MVRSKFVLFLVIFGFSTLSFAELPWGQETPLQAYHQAGGQVEDEQAATPTEKTAVAATAHNTAKVKKEGVASVTTTEKAATPATTDPNDLTDTAAQEALQDQLTIVNQNNILFEQATNNKIIALNQQIQQLQKQSQQLGQALQLLNQEVVSLLPHQAVTHAEPSFLGSLFSGITREHVLWGVAAVVILMTLLSLIWTVRRFSQQVKPGDAADDTQGEYDYMGSSESIPAKLNLARAYLAMENYAGVQNVVSEVLLHGNPQQQKEAEALRQQIPLEPAPS